MARLSDLDGLPVQKQQEVAEPPTTGCCQRQSPPSPEDDNPLYSVIIGADDTLSLVSVQTRRLRERGTHSKSRGVVTSHDSKYLDGPEESFDSLPASKALHEIHTATLFLLNADVHVG